MTKDFSQSFSENVLNWFDQHGRKNLPWQQNKSPYRVWISEIMLQQTQVNTVIAYFERFIARFPDIKTLASANEDEVLHLWTGLGYYNRARNLHRTAKMIVSAYHGKFPQQLDELQKLPGIGRSTAGAISALGFEQRAAILDGNVKRVLTRYHGITEWPGEKKVLDQLWMFAEKYTPTDRVADYTQAMMDIGATLCSRSTPQCSVCPLKNNCVALQKNIAKKLPKAKPKKTLSVRQITWLILQNEGKIFLEKRPPMGVWASLWSFPEILNTTSNIEIKKICRQQFQSDANKIYFGESFRHTFSHFHLDILPAFIAIKKTALKIREDANQNWYELNKLPKIGLPKPVKLLLEKLKKSLKTNSL